MAKIQVITRKVKRDRSFDFTKEFTDKDYDSWLSCGIRESDIKLKPKTPKLAVGKYDHLIPKH